MSEPWTDDERLAAFLDGRLDERGRNEMLARLTADDEAYERFAGTASILRQAEAEEAALAAVPDASPDEDVATDAEMAPVAAEDLPPVDEPARNVIFLADRAREPRADPAPDAVSTPAWNRGTALRWMALAAVLAAVALVVGPWRPRASAAGDPVRLAARLEPSGSGLPGVWYPWSSARGNEADNGRTPEEKAARAGGLLMDLAMAVQGRDSVRTSELAVQAGARFDPNAGPTGPLKKIEAAAGSEPGALLPLVAQATERIAKQRGQRDALQLGAWIEAARIAAKRRDAAFMCDGETRRMLDRARSVPSAGEAVRQVRLLLPEPCAPRWDALPGALYDLASEVGGR